MGKAIKENREEIRLTKIVLLDELDYMITRDQSVLYNLFEWPQRKHANLIVISVANTLDLPETFMARISSRIGNTRLVFGPYNSSEIKEIIEERVKSTGLFDSTALQFISKKVALISSDIRKTLMICRQAVDRFREAQKVSPTECKKAITIEFVSSVFDSVYTESPIMAYVKNANETMRQFLTEMYQEMKANQGKTAAFRKIYERYRNAASGSLDKFTPQEMLNIAKCLQARSIVQIKHNCKSQQMELIFQTGLDELAYSLKDDPYFSKKVVI